jgi:hypothetical protein
LKNVQRIIQMFILFGILIWVVPATQSSGDARLFFPAGIPQAWRLSDGKLQPIDPSRLSLSALPGPSIQQNDLNGDDQPESIRLSRSRLEIFSGDTQVWQSPLEWQIAQAAIADLNRDRLPEVILLVWRPFQPWPIDRILPNPGRIRDFHDASGKSCHLILIGWKRGAYGELWAGSALAEPLLAYTPVDLDGDGFLELADLETTYDSPPGSQSTALSIWEWNGFGFSLLDRVEGNFLTINSTIDREGNTILLTGK